MFGEGFVCRWGCVQRFPKIKAGLQGTFGAFFQMQGCFFSLCLECAFCRMQGNFAMQVNSKIRCIEHWQTEVRCVDLLIKNSSYPWILILKIKSCASELKGACAG
jgi:hypothetical protein